MLRFRPPTPGTLPGDVTDLLAVGELIDAVMRPGNFFVDPSLPLTWIAARAETIPWEIYRGRLLPRAQTREQKSFLAWHVTEPEASEPTISVKVDVHTRHLHVTRGFQAYVWEAHGDSVIDTRETIAWTRELVGSIALADYANLESVRDELICLVWQAVVGTSRLPLTSVEAPLPSYSFGLLHYVYRGDALDRPMRLTKEVAACADQADLAPREVHKLLEFGMRRPGTGEWCQVLETYFKSRALSTTQFREVFNDVSLSPYTCFVDHALNTVAFGAQPEAHIDFCADLLNKLHRHLTAYDLVTFHHRGANYPDALLLDRVLGTYAALVNAPEFSGAELKSRKRRRALRQACLLRRHYDGHLVPDTPTSPGENARILPASHPRVPQEQIEQSMRRHKQLFADADLNRIVSAKARIVLAQSVQDLDGIEERVEMGLALFIDRPLGYAKQVGESDLTPMLANEAFSPSIARRRWAELKKLCRELDVATDDEKLDAMFADNTWPAGLASAELAECPRPVAALSDTRKVAADFVILRTLPRGLGILLDLFDWRPLVERYRLQFLSEREVRLCVQVVNERKEAVIALFDSELRRRLELSIDASQGYACRAGIEWPRAGLRVKTVWEDTDEPKALKHYVDLDVTVRAIGH